MAWKQNGRWRVKWIENGKRKTRQFPKGTPKRVVDDFEREKRMFRHGTFSEESPAFAAWSEVWFEEMCRLFKTRSSQVKDRGGLDHHLLPRFGARKIDKITSQDIFQLQSDLWQNGEGYAAQSVNNIVSLCSSIMKYAVVCNKIPVNPCAGIRRVKRLPRRPTFWTFEEADKFLNTVRMRDYPLFQLCAFALNTGLRPGELQGLLRDCLDYSAGYVHVRRNWCTKTNLLLDYTKNKIERKVPLSPVILDLMTSKRFYEPAQPVFGVSWNAFGFRFIRPYAELAGVKPIRFHDFRHTFASHLIMKGKHPVEVKELLGHRKLDTTMQYVHLADDATRGATDCLTEGMSWMRPDAEVVSLRAT